MDTPADAVTQTEDDAAALAMRRLTLRAYADRIAQIVEGLDLPDTFLEAERAARAITAADRIIEQLPLTPEDTVPDTTADSPPAARKAPRLRLRARADRLLEVIGRIPDPDSYLEGERASRCLLASDRMLSQVYEAPQSPNRHKACVPKFPAFADDLDDLDDEDDPADSDGRAEFLARADRYATGCARNSGIWPDGTAFDTDAPAPQSPWRLADSLTIFQCESDPAQKDRWQALLMLNRANAVIRAMARRDGRWPDYSPFGEDDPDYYSLSARFDEEVLKTPPAKDEDRPRPDHKEIPNTIGFPWWLVRQVPP